MNRFIHITSALVLACALSSAGAADDKKTSPPETPTMQQMQGNMQAMRDLMAKIHATQDPVARRKLLQQHRDLMQNQMGMMKQHMGGMGSMGAMGAMGGGCGGMMEQMMEQMMQHEDATADGDKKPAG